MAGFKGATFKFLLGVGIGISSLYIVNIYFLHLFLKQPGIIGQTLLRILFLLFHFDWYYLSHFILL
jgi:hypothetical protein